MVLYCKEIELTDPENRKLFFSSSFVRVIVNVSSTSISFPVMIANIIKNDYTYSDNYEPSCMWGLDSIIGPKYEECFCYIIAIKMSTKDEITIGKKCKAMIDLVNRKGSVYEKRQL
jgi:hypothetical protein